MLKMNDLPNEIIQEIILYSVNYATIYTARQSLSNMKICSRWNEIIEYVKHKVSQIMEIDISQPIVILKHDHAFQGFYWNRYRVSINKERSDMEVVQHSEWDLEISDIPFEYTWNSLILINENTAVIYKESLNRMKYEAEISLEDIITSNYTRIIETSIGVRIEIEDDDNSYSIIFLDTGQCRITTVYTYNVIISSFTILYDYIVFRTDDNRNIIMDHKTKTIKTIDPGWDEEVPIMSCGDIILLTDNLFYIAIYSISKGHCIRRFKGKYIDGCNGSVLCDNVIYHFYTDSFIKVRELEPRHIFKHNLKYYIIE